MTDEELLKMMEEIEEQEMHQAPDYLKQMILDKAERIQVRDSIEILPMATRKNQRKNLMEPESKNPKGKKIQLLIYSAKIAAATAAALALLYIWPQYQSKVAIQQNVEWEQQQKEQERQNAKEQQLKQDQKKLAQREKDSVTEKSISDQREDSLEKEEQGGQINQVFDQIKNFLSDQLFEGRTEK